MRVVIAGGGTGGHVYPGLAVAAELQLQDRESEILFLGTERGLESTLVPRAKFDFQAIRARGLSRRPSLEWFAALFENPRGLWQARRIIKRFRPDVVLGMGGYASAAGVLAGWLLDLPTVIHEQNALPGVANRLLSRIAGRILVSSPDAVSRFPKGVQAEMVGNPIRPSILRITREEAVRRLELSPDKKTILVFGGSRGARSINQATIEAVRLLRLSASRIQIIFLTGQEHHTEAEKALRGSLVDVRVLPYLDEMPLAIAAADLAVCRAGATTLAELTARGVAAILIPFPFATGNHQEYNARSLVEAGGARMILDAELNGHVLASAIQDLLRTHGTVERMGEAMRTLGRPDAAEQIVGILRSEAAKGRSGRLL